MSIFLEKHYFLGYLISKSVKNGKKREFFCQNMQVRPLVWPQILLRGAERWFILFVMRSSLFQMLVFGCSKHFKAQNSQKLISTQKTFSIVTLSIFSEKNICFRWYFMSKCVKKLKNSKNGPNREILSFLSVSRPPGV